MLLVYAVLTDLDTSSLINTFYMSADDLHNYYIISIFVYSFTYFIFSFHNNLSIKHIKRSSSAQLSRQTHK